MGLKTLIKHLQGQHDQKSHAKGGGKPFFTGDYPLAGAEVDGREVLDNVDNLSSISASLNEWEEKPGIREIPMSDFDFEGFFYAKNDFDHSRDLAARIEQSGKISPLIVVVDNEGPYILEGAHRAYALNLLNAKSLPALVVMDTELIDD